jgi:hypothetical protein
MTCCSTCRWAEIRLVLREVIGFALVIGVLIGIWIVVAA